MLLILFLLSIIIFYCIMAIMLRLPPFKTVRVFKKRDKGKKRTLSGLINVFAGSLSQYIPMGMLKEAELKKVLQAAGMKITPKEYTAAAIVHSLPFLLLAVPVFFMNKVLALIPVLFCGYVFYHRYTDASRKGDRRKLEIEKELPRFVGYMAQTLKSSRNIIDMIDTYKANYSSALTEELSITVADMRTGNQEQALRNLDTRINSPLMDEMIRGLLAAVAGNNMSAYFDNLSYKLNTVWRQRLTEQALKKEPKVAMMSYILFGCAMVTVFVLLGVMLKSSSTMLGV